MNLSDFPTFVGSNTDFQIGETIYEPKSYRCHLAIIREEDGRFSAVILNLPGSGSCGDTEEEAVNNAREAVAGVITSHLESGSEIPWLDPTQYTVPEGAKQKVILVNV